MADIVTTRIFQDGEKNITAQKLNDIVASSTIQPAFVSSKPSTSTIATTDNLLVLQTAGTYAKAPFQTVIDSVNAGLNTDAEIWKVRLRSFNAIGNPTFEIDQRFVGNTLANPAHGSFVQDRWTIGRIGTLAVSTQQIYGAGGIPVPGTNFALTRSFLRITLTTAEASLAASDQLQIAQTVEGPQWRELQSDVHSVQLLVRSSVAGLNFGLSIRDNPATKSLTSLCTISAANTWTLITLPNLPIWPAGNFVNTPGNVGYILSIVLAAGTTLTSPANGTWQNGNFLGAVGQSNFAASAVNSTFDIVFVQHEPGTVCSTPMDCPFTTNYDACLRYFQKSTDLDVAPTTVNANGCIALNQASTTSAVGPTRFGKPMAKIPTMTAYNHATAAVNSIRFGGTDYAVSSFSSPGKTGFIGIVTATLPAVTAGAYIPLHYTADTGW